MAILNTGLKNETKISELLVSGSEVIKTKNEFGVYMFEDKDKTDGIVFGKMQKPKYNQSQLEKSIDTNIYELLPAVSPELPETVLKSVYDVQVLRNDELVSEIEDLNNFILDLEGQITELRIQIQGLQSTLDAKDLALASSENQSNQANLQVQSSITDLQNAIQKSTSEVIQRVSAYAQNESLKGQVAQLEEQVNTATKQINTLNNTILQQNGVIQAKDSSIDKLNADNSTLQTNLIKVGNNKKKIICDMLYRQGFIPEHIWAADEAFGEMMLKTNRQVAMGYLMWAQSVVDYFTINPQYSKYLYVAVKPWSEHMAYMMGVLPNDNLIGKGLHFIGCQYSSIIYNAVKLKRKYKKKKLSLGWL
jgi:predicted  nucleic acid-binding Zn-ribbon protein